MSDKLMCPFCGKSELELEAVNHTIFCRECGAKGPLGKGFMCEWEYIKTKDLLWLANDRINKLQKLICDRELEKLEAEK